jgi:NAD(P)-dependent dehydrogenase (short-subunit alcohol dehydrogenase family)
VEIIVKVVVITGTSTGIGLATAVHFARRGHRVVATMRDPQRSSDLEKAAADAGVSVDVRQLDVDDDASVHAAIDGVLRDAGRIDVLVNNAGVGWMRPWEQVAMSAVEQTFRTNVFGALRCAQAVLPGMRENRAGAIVNVASIAGRVAAPIQGAYCASKYALVAFTESLAVEVRQFGIHVAAVLPGFFATPILTKAWEGRAPDEHDPYADLLRRWDTLYAGARRDGGDPTDVARAIETAADDATTICRFVGADAEAFNAGRERMGDAGWLRYGDRQTDEQWWSTFAGDFGPAT